MVIGRAKKGESLGGVDVKIGGWDDEYTKYLFCFVLIWVGSKDTPTFPLFFFFSFLSFFLLLLASFNPFTLA